MRIFLILLIALLAVPATGTSSHGARHGGWTLESDKDGIKIYTRTVKGSKLKQVRAVVLVKAPLETVMRIITDYQGYDEWMNNVTESYVMHQPSDSIQYVYRYEDAPWPVQNRYHVDRMVVERGIDDATIAFKSMPNYIDKTDEAIEVEQYEGSWHISDNGRGECMIEYTLDENPGGFVPPWLVNYLAVDSPFRTLSNLRDRVETLQRS